MDARLRYSTPISLLLCSVALCCVWLLALPALAIEGENVDDRVSATFTGLRLNRATRTFDTVGTLTNNASNGSVSTPISVVITHISSPNVSVANASGLTPRRRSLRRCSSCGGDPLSWRECE